MRQQSQCTYSERVKEIDLQATWAKDGKDLNRRWGEIATTQ
jgi:hypothetical protein